MYRSTLFVPCANARAMAKAKDLECDALIFDLEDAVGPEERDGALAALVAALTAGEFAAGHVLVRIHPGSFNAIHKTLHELRVDGLVVPKVNGTEDLRGILIAWPKMPLWAMIETAESAANLWEIAGLPLKGLIAGPNDLRKSLRTRPMAGRQDILFALSQVVLYGRANGLVVLDGVYNQYTDEIGFEAECAQGRSLGFDGKTLIHPAQIAGANRAFSPSEAEVAWARAVVAAFDGKAGGIVAVNGEMVERLHLAQAQATLAAIGG